MRDNMRWWQKSINIKRLAAVAAGIAMVGSVMASGLA